MSDVTIVTFVFAAVKTAVDDLGLCLCKNGSFLWQLAQAFADEEVDDRKLGWVKEFWQMSSRMVGTDRRLIALKEAVGTLKTNGLMQSVVAADSTTTLSDLLKQIDDGMEHIDQRVQYTKDSFEHLNAMVVDVTDSKRSDAAITLVKSGRALAFAALIYSPASVAIGVFGMDLDFIKDMKGRGAKAFGWTLFACYVPVLL